MRIGLNLLYLLPGIVGGTETYAKGLLEGLAEIDQQNEYFVFVNRESETWPLPEAANFRRVVCPVRAVSRARRYLFEQLRLPFFIRPFNLQVLHSLGYMTPAFLPSGSVVTIHDLLYDYPAPLLRRMLLRFFVTLSARSSDRILTGSEVSKKQIASRLGVPAEKIRVIPNAPKDRTRRAADIEAIKRRLGLRDAYLMALSSFSPSKNIPRLLHALALLERAWPEDHRLVLAGHMPSRGTTLFAEVEKLGLGKRVVFTGYLPDEELIVLLRHASVFVFPSLYEGFGIPVLEAMEAGVPVACSDAASLPEVAGDAALMFDPLSVEAIAAAVMRLIDDPDLRADLIGRGHRNVARFSWRRAAEETLQVYRDLTRSQE